MPVRDVMRRCEGYPGQRAWCGTFAGRFGLGLGAGFRQDLGIYNIISGTAGGRKFQKIKHIRAYRNEAFML